MANTFDNWDIKDRVVLITGANSGIGKVTARILAKNGRLNGEIFAIRSRYENG